MKILAINSNYNYKQYHVRPVFNGRYINGKYFSDEIIDIAKRYIKAGKTPVVDDFRKGFLNCLEESKFQPIEWAFSPFVWYLKKVTGEDPDRSVNELARLSAGISTLGLSELLKAPEAAIRNKADKDKAEKKRVEVLECMYALKNEDL